jgi:hypothetical protein
VCFHVDDCKLSHEHSKVVDETIKWLRAEYESIFEDGLGAMKVHRGKVHKYLGMTLDFSHNGQLLLLCMTTWMESSRRMMRLRTSMMTDSYPSQNSAMRRQPLKICSRWMMTVRSFQKKWQQTSTLSLQRHCKPRGQGLIYAY